jgi:hypothetical protein
VKRIENEVGPGEEPQASGALRLLKFLGLNTRLHHSLGEGQSYRSEAWRYCSALANVERKTHRLCREFRAWALPRWKERKAVKITPSRRPRCAWPNPSLAAAAAFGTTSSAMAGARDGSLEAPPFRAGLPLKGSPLPANDGDLFRGFFFGHVCPVAYENDSGRGKCRFFCLCHRYDAQTGRRAFAGCRPAGGSADNKRRRHAS